MCCPSIRKKTCLFALAIITPHQEKKRRDFLCERRSRSRGRPGDWSITTGASSAGGRSSSLTSARSQSSYVRERMDSVTVGATGEGNNRSAGEGDEHEGSDGGGDGEETFSSLEFPIARRVNARRPSTTATETAARSKRQENVATKITGSSSSFSAAPLGGHQARTCQPPPSKPRLLENRISALGRNGESSAEQGLAANDSPPSAQVESTGATVTRTKRPRTSVHAVAALPDSSSRFLGPLLSADGASAGSSPLQLVNTTTTAAAAATASTVGGQERAVLKYPQRQRRYSSLSFAQNPHATTAEMIRRYRGQLRRASSSSQQPRVRVASTSATMPPLLAGGRRRSDGSTPWHFYNATKTNKAAASRPRTSVGGSRWSQDVRLQQHARGRSRLAPATRTAGGRWGANHGRLEALVPGDESESSTTSITYRIPREGGPWVLDAEPRIDMIRNPEQDSFLRS